MPKPSEPPQTNRSTASAIWGWGLPAGFALLTVCLLYASRLAPIPVSAAAVVDPAALVPGPRRVSMTDPAHLMVEGKPENCNACHQLFSSSHQAGAALNYHKEVQLHHGLNNRCTNCHDSEDRERLTLRDGATVAFVDTPQLCSQCHGTVYRDWQRGTHGKTMGSWITGSPAQIRLGCNECHDPHSPRYPGFNLLPGPDTLRMGDQHFHGEAEVSRSPLLRLFREAESGDAIAPIPGGNH